MHLDIRRLIGGMFVLIGLLLVGYGSLALSVPGRPLWIDVAWGGVMTVFGTLMLGISIRAARLRRAPTVDKAPR